MGRSWKALRAVAGGAGQRAYQTQRIRTKSRRWRYGTQGGGRLQCGSCRDRPGGGFTIETKTRSKPLRGKPEIHFDGETLKVGSYTPDRDPIVQAQVQATWLRRQLTESTGKVVPVRPVVLFPGWNINDSRQNKRNLWVLEPKALPGWLGNEKAVLAPDEVAMASSHLSRYIRFQERLLDQAS
jgi:hypothetical protein